MKIKIQKNEIIGVIIGIVFTLLVIGIHPHYLDYTDKAKVAQWLTVFKQANITKTIENDLLTRQQTTEKTFTLENTNVETGYVNTLGQVFLKSTGKGYILILIPQKINNKIEWHCFGGNNQAMPSICREDFSTIKPL